MKKSWSIIVGSVYRDEYLGVEKYSALKYHKVSFRAIFFMKYAVLYLCLKYNRYSSAVICTKGMITVATPNGIETLCCFSGEVCILNKIYVKIKIFKKVYNVSPFLLTPKAPTIISHKLKVCHSLATNLE